MLESFKPTTLGETLDVVFARLIIGLDLKDSIMVNSLKYATLHWAMGI